MLKFKRYTDDTIFEDNKSYLLLLNDGSMTMMWYSSRKGLFPYEGNHNLSYEDISMYSEVEVQE